MQKSGVSVEPDGFSGPAHVNPSAFHTSAFTMVLNGSARAGPHRSFYNKSSKTEGGSLGYQKPSDPSQWLAMI